MPSEPLAVKENKHGKFHEQINALEQQIDRLGTLVNRIEGGTNDVCYVPKEQKASHPSLADFLTEGMDCIANLSSTIGALRGRIEAALF